MKREKDFLKSEIEKNLEKENDNMSFEHNNLFVESTNKKYTTNRKMHGRQGHGFVAEEVNTTIDRLALKNAEIKGNNFKKNGPDREVEGVLIQTKYCKNAKASIAACYKNGEFRYPGCKIEVPKDQVNEAWEEIKKRENLPKEANNWNDYIVKGQIKYQTALNLAKPNNFIHVITSIGLDASSGLVEPTFMKNMGIGSALAFMQGIWRGNSIKEAFSRAICMALKNTGTAAFSSVYAGQFAKYGGAALINKIGEYGAKKVSGKIAKKILKTVPKVPIAGEIFSTAAIITMDTLFDVVNIIRRHISVRQFFKDSLQNAIETTAGSAGSIGGDLLGRLVPFPNPVTPFLGRKIGEKTSKLIAGKTTDFVLDLAIEDDDARMIRIIEEEYCILAEDYLVSDIEAEEIIADFAKKIKPGLTRQMLFSKDKYQFAETFIRPSIEKVINKRPRIPIISNNQKNDLFEEIINEAIESIDDDCERMIDYKEAKTNEFGDNICPYCGAIIGGIGYSICKYCDSLVEMPS